jgi:hypothetical protein
LEIELPYVLSGSKGTQVTHYLYAFVLMLAFDELAGGIEDVIVIEGVVDLAKVEGRRVVTVLYYLL